MAESSTITREGFSFPQPQRGRMYEVLRRLGEAAIRTQKITEHGGAAAAQNECLRAIEALVTEALEAEGPVGWTWDEIAARLRACSIHSIAGGEPERYLIKIGCPNIQTMQAVRDGMVQLREAIATPATAQASDPADQTDALAKLAEIPPAGDAVSSIWHVVICLPGLNTDHYFASETKPSLEQIEAFWRARHPNDDRPVRPRGWNGPLRDAYPGIALIERIDITTLATGAARG